MDANLLENQINEYRSVVLFELGMIEGEERPVSASEQLRKNSLKGCQETCFLTSQFFFFLPKKEKLDVVWQKNSEGPKVQEKAKGTAVVVATYHF